MRDSVRVALAQMNCSLGDKEANLSKALNIIKKVGGLVDIVCFPEFFTTGYDLTLLGESIYGLAETIPGRTTKELAKAAKKAGVGVIGVIPEEDGVIKGILYNTAFAIDSDGELVGKYRKTHLYPTEHLFFRAGNELKVFKLCGTYVGIAICFDHAFPEVFRVLALKGAQVVFIPISEPKGYEHLQRLRTRARAQDNQIFVASVNHVGKEGTVTYCGESMIANPKGEVVAKGSPDREEVIIKTLNLNEVLKERISEPSLRCLRPDLYESICVVR